MYMLEQDENLALKKAKGNQTCEFYIPEYFAVTPTFFT